MVMTTWTMLCVKDLHNVTVIQKSQEGGTKDRSMAVAFVVVKTHINGRVTSITEAVRALPVGAAVAASQSIAAKGTQVTANTNQVAARANQAKAARANQAVVRASHQGAK